MTLILLSLLGSIAAHADNSNLYLYRAELTNVQVDDMHDGTARLTGYMKKSGLSDACIDIQERGAAISGEYSAEKSITIITAGSEEMLLKRQLTEAEEENLKNAICAGQPRCDVKFTFKSAPVSKLSIDSISAGIHDEGPNFRQKMKVKDAKSIPAFSNSCQTGVYEDSWTNAAATSESREYLKNNGIDITKVRNFRMSIQNGNRADNFWDFGFPNHDLDRHGSPMPNSNNPISGLEAK